MSGKIATSHFAEHQRSRVNRLPKSDVVILPKSHACRNQFIDSPKLIRHFAAMDDSVICPNQRHVASSDSILSYFQDSSVLILPRLVRCHFAEISVPSFCRSNKCCPFTEVYYRRFDRTDHVVIMFAARNDVVILPNQQCRNFAAMRVPSSREVIVVILTKLIKSLFRLPK